MPLSRTPERAVGRGRGAWGRRIRQMTAGALALAGGVVATAGPAAADGPTTFANATAIAVPATGSANQTGPASPYPSSIAVSGLAGSVTTVTVALNNLTHSTVNDIDAMVVAPDGSNLVVLSDVGDPTSSLAFANNATLTFSDTGASPVPTGNIPTGTYTPTNNGAGDAFPAPAPAASAQTTLAGAFSGISPNGSVAAVRRRRRHRRHRHHHRRVEPDHYHSGRRGHDDHDGHVVDQPVNHRPVGHVHRHGHRRRAAR